MPGAGGRSAVSVPVAHVAAARHFRGGRTRSFRDGPPSANGSVLGFLWLLQRAQRALPDSSDV